MRPPVLAAHGATVFLGDCLDVLAEIPDASIDSIVTDPPYGLGFMGKAWDALPPGREWAEECLRVLKPGGHLLAFGGSRTWHRLAVAVEDAGFEIRDSIAWLYGSGFPKSLDVSKAIDKARTEDLEPAAAVARFLVAAMEARGVTRADVNRFFGHSTAGSGAAQQWTTTRTDRTIKPRVPSWEQWEQLRGYLGFADDVDAEVWRLNGRKGTPGEAWESREITGTVDEWTDRVNYALTSRDGLRRDVPATPAASQWQGWGTALKPAFEPVVVGRKPLVGTVAANVLAYGTGALNIDGCRVGSDATQRTQRGTTKAWEGGAFAGEHLTGSESGRWPANVVFDESQAAALDESRFFYVAKAPKSERPVVDGVAHPTVKPLSLMRQLVRLVTPPGGVVLDTFAGSGTTGEAAILEGFDSILIERGEEYLPLIEARLSRAVPGEGAA